MRMVDKPELGKYATFVPMKREPIYSWFYYKEGYSKQLVFWLLDRMGVKDGVVLDPFCGVGTTLLACKQRNIDSIGFDVSDLAVFAANTKLHTYDPDELFKAIKEITKLKPSPVKSHHSALVKRCFLQKNLDQIEFYKKQAMNFPSPIRDFLLLGLITSSQKCSYAFKDGAKIKTVKKPVPPVKAMLRRTLMHMLHDVKEFDSTGAHAEARVGDARFLPKLHCDAVITSPPYLNKIEYAQIYSIEDELFFPGRKPSLRSAIGTDPDADFPGDLPPIAKAYFKDMDLVLKTLSQACSGPAALVVGNGCFPDGVVESDTILAELAERHGFTAEELVVLNKRWCTRNRTEKVGIARESAIIIRK